MHYLSFFKESLLPYPFVSISSDVELISSIVIYVIVGLFLFSLIWLVVKLYILNVKIQKYTNNFSAEEIKNDPHLNIAWAQYKEAFLSKDSNWQKTENEAIKYFNEGTILSSYLNMRYWFALPNILVGLGLLGTFSGLTFGIAGFDTGTTEAIKLSINNLLMGMTTAFTTSIWGMTLSIVFNICEKFLFQKVNNSLYKLALSFDKQFKLSKADLVDFIKVTIEQLFNDFFAAEIDDKEVKPSIFFRELMFNSEQQTKALKSFSTDLADGIRISSETINQMGNSFGGALQNSFSKDLFPSIDRLNNVVEQLQKVKEQSSGEIIERIISDLNVSLEKMLKQVHESLSSSAITSLENLSQIVAASGASLSTFPQQMEETIIQFKKEIAALQNDFKESALLVNRETAATTAVIRQETENSTKELSETVNSLQNNILKIIQRQEESTFYVDELIGNFKNTLTQNQSLTEEINTSFGKFKNTLENMDSLSLKMLQSADVLKMSSDTLQTKSDSFEKQCNLFLNENQKTLEHLQKALIQAKDTADDYATKFAIIQDGLSGIFQKIETGLNDYQTATKESLNNYLKDFTQHLTSAASSLSGSITELEEVFEILQSQIRE